ncbi:Golgin subfamily A member 7/ERF4 family-domain-containing protein [Absidia repens]|uniref:Ras modification protein ERF4 n=1 Tax=Absidia repens TaxID=90262 RepID=A0A1X2IC53_9FUNG|nr:Golgin subfamily A member 7/ERF4 family-domain-containing protein [Absidia repens]
MKEDYSHPQRRYTDTCLYLTPASPLYTNATRNRLSCTVPSSSSSITDPHRQHHRRRLLSLDGHIPLLPKNSKHRRHSTSETIRYHLPISLQGKITSEQFVHTITTINTMLESAERLSWSGVLYNTMEILTIYLWPLFFNSHYHKMIHQLLAFIDKENNEVYQKQKLSICNPVKAAFLFIEIQVFD